jgi:phosphopantetheine--protein transferase-like protein
LLDLFGGAVMSVDSEMREQLRDLIATMLRVPAAEVSEGTLLAALNTSLGSAKVRLGLKRLGLALPAGAAPATFGGLLAALSGEAVSQADEKVNSVPRPLPSAAGNGGFAGLQVGLDVEDIRSLPEASDYWEHEFYRGSFSKSEIAYAVLHVEPRTHFAGFWCAKEALRKCDPAFAGVAPELTAVAHDANGRPYLTLETEAGPERLAHAVSISHTAEVATAVVVLAPAAAVVEAAPAPQVNSLEVVAAAEAKRPRGLAKLFGI